MLMRVFGDTSTQPRAFALLKVAHFDFNVAVVVPFVEFGREGQTAAAAGGHKFVHPVAHAERHGSHSAATLADAKAEVPVAPADAFWLAGDFQPACEKSRTRILRAVRLKPINFV